ncbi:MAG: regulatory iron-sulfur-containing complex subunit RicT [Rikenellaceae bacterium]
MDNDKKYTCNKNNCKFEIDRGAAFSVDEDGSSVAVSIESGYKLHSTNWLEEVPEVLDNNIFEVRFKNTRRGYYANVNNLPLKKGDIVAVESSPGHDVGIISLTGDLVARQMKRVGFNPQNGEFKKIYRKAKPYDIEKWQDAIALEHDTMIRARQYAAQLGLDMKIGDVEYQGDKIKAIFYYIADERVDFRELIKVFAEQFRIRVEMKQIGARQEAGRIGGLGSCGREQCCSSWISSFVSVTTNTARTQDISLNPQKLAGQCGKLKCCLTYEFDSYMDARRELPRVNQPLQILEGNYFLVKTDILTHTMSFSTDPHSLANMKSISAKRVREIQKLNAQGIKPDTLESAEVNASRRALQEPTFTNAMGQESITRFDRSKGGDRRNNGNRSRNGGRNNRNSAHRSENLDQNKVEKVDKSENTNQPNQPKRGPRPQNRGNNPSQERKTQDRDPKAPRVEKVERAERAPQAKAPQGENNAEGTNNAAPRRNNGPRGGNRNGNRGGQRRPRPNNNATGENNKPSGNQGGGESK